MDLVLKSVALFVLLFFFFGVLRVNVSFRLEFMYPYILGYTVVM